MIQNFTLYVIGNAGMLGQGLLVTLRVCVLGFILAVLLAVAVSLIQIFVPWLRLAGEGLCGVLPRHADPVADAVGQLCLA